MEQIQDFNNDTVIRNISFDQSEILHNIMNLYNDGKPFECDITASELKFYQKNKQNKYEIPVPKILMDVYPQRDDIIKITPFQKLPLEDNSLSSIVFDPPFIISPRDTPSKTIKIKKGSNLVSNRFSSFYPVDELYYNYYWWIKDIYRVLKDDGIFVLKCMSTVSGGYQHNCEEWSFMCGVNSGFYCIDKFYLEAKARIVANSHFKNGQKHARKYTSVFYVFQKNDKMANKYNYFEILKKLENEDFKNVVFKTRKTKKRETNNSSDVIVETPVVTKKKRKSNKKIVQLSKNGTFIRDWDSYDDIIKEIKISKASLSQCVHGKIKTSGGFIWKMYKV